VGLPLLGLFAQLAISLILRMEYGNYVVVLIVVAGHVVLYFAMLVAALVSGV
jgi:hypothetical protein